MKNFLKTKEISVNLQLIQVYDNQIVNCLSKTTLDGLTNAIIKTYNNFPQRHSMNLVWQKRDVNVATERAVNFVLTNWVKTHQRGLIKPNLKKPLLEKLDIISQLDWTITDFKQNTDYTDAIKSIAFYVGQNWSLINGTHIHDKTDLKHYHPILEPYINRDFNNLQNLINYTNCWKNLIKQKNGKNK
jgi:hypothetical protein